MEVKNFSVNWCYFGELFLCIWNNILDIDLHCIPTAMYPKLLPSFYTQIGLIYTVSCRDSFSMEHLSISPTVYCKSTAEYQLNQFI